MKTWMDRTMDQSMDNKPMQTDIPAPAQGAVRECPAAETGTPRRGRPRSEAAERAIFCAVETLMESGVGLTELSIERIAAEAGVGKATIYRRWPNKEALLVDVLARLEEPEPTVPAGGTVRDDLIAMVDYMRRRGLAKRSRWVLQAALGQMTLWPELYAMYKERVIQPRRRRAAAIIARGIEEGVFRPDLDPELLAELLLGPILVRTVLWNEAPLDDPELAEKMVDAVLNGIAAEQPAEAR